MVKKTIDEYIEEQRSPQKEICQILRKLILKTYPSIKEEMKYGVPYFGNKFYIVDQDDGSLGYILLWEKLKMCLM